MMKKIPTKPPEAQWTDEQWKAIYASGSDILVSAAAGSGKTAVLIERLIQKILAPEDERIDVDELLVVTFTSASAAEMRSRMAEALEKVIEKNPENTFVRRQLSLLNKAQISTLHSFCLAICRQYAYRINLDPGFRIASQDEMALLRDDVLAQVLEDAYRADEEIDFTRDEMYRLVDSFTSDRNDQDIEKLIEKLYEMSRVQPNPYAWLDMLPTKYDLPDGITVDDLEYVKELKQSIEYDLIEAANAIDVFKMYSTAQFNLGEYEEIALTESGMVHAFLQAVQTGTWQDAYDIAQGIQWANMARGKRPKGFNPEDKEIATDSRAQAKKIVTKIATTFFARKPDYLVQEIRNMKPIIETLVKLTKMFNEAFKAEKQRKGVVDFSDLEHFALEILTEHDEQGLRPSQVALEFQQRFKEVLVDEYQDTNVLQETILQLVKAGDEGNGNLFMVGDVKQSIYAFRLAEPRLFLSKYKKFKETPTDSGMRIDLNANFRSRQEVLKGTNYVFEQIMDEAVGEIDYDEQAALKYGASYPNENVPVELVILNEKSDDKEADEVELTSDVMNEEELKRAQKEARYIIQEIQKMKDNEAQVYDSKKKLKRPVKYSDIVILVRSKSWAGMLAEEFKQAGIPLYADASSGYFEALEVMVMMNVLKIIDNPYQDIPLASVLRAPFVGLTENELAEVRLAKANVPYYEALQAYMENGTATVIQKLAKFMEQLQAWRDFARHGSLADLIWMIYLQTNYFEMVGAMMNGKQRQANLRLLHDRALSYEKSSFRGLFRFLRFIDRMQSRGDDLGVAKAIGEGDDVVRLVTIHSSKGLEFPVVFVADMAHQFNTMDFHSKYIFDQDFGLAVKAIDPENRIMATSLPFLALKEKKMAKLKAEEMRILYVAMTRAKERLILVGSVKNWDKKKAKWEALQGLTDDEKLPNYLRATSMNYLEWVGNAVARHPDFLTIASNTKDTSGALTDSLWQVRVVEADAFTTPAQQLELLELEVQREVDANLLHTLTERFTAQYAYEQATTMSSKKSVSEIKRIESLQRLEEQGYNPTVQTQQKTIARRPLFKQDKKLTSAEIGTAVHTVMQHIPQYGLHTVEEAQHFIDTMVTRELLTVEEAVTIDAAKVAAFFKTDIGQRFMEAQMMLREVPFTLSYKTNDADTDAQIVQGVIDCMFLEDNGWVLLDYKTDKVRPPFDVEPKLTQEMTNRYETQLRIYTEAIEKIKRVKVQERILFLYDIGKSISI